MVNQYLKAFFAAASAGLGSLATVLVGSTTSFSDVSSAQWVVVAIAVVGAFSVTWAVPNVPKA